MRSSTAVWVRNVRSRWEIRQDLRLQVLTHQLVAAAERDRRAPQRAALPQVQRREVQPGRPPLGPPIQVRHVIVAERHVGVAQQ
jgi:hypothetical protein